MEKLYSTLIGGSWKNNWTLGSEICRIKNAPDGREQIDESLGIYVQNDRDIQRAIDILCDSFFGIALPFYERFSSLIKIDELYNEPPFEHMPVLVQRTLADQCMKGLLIAKMINRDNFGELVTIFDQLITIPENKKARKDYELVKRYVLNLNNRI